MYFNNAGWLLSLFYPDLVWRRKTRDKVIYLTFDDGPIPEITEYVLDVLKSRAIHATFFCVGDNIRKHPEIFKRIIEDGHRIGNHTFNHLKGWKTEDEVYCENIEKCTSIINSNQEHKVNLFRPPYGLIKKSQIRRVKDKYQIIMWDVLTGDFDPKHSPEECLNKAKKFTRSGSIVVFHDNIKAKNNLYYALPAYIDCFLEKGYRFEKL